MTNKEKFFAGHPFELNGQIVKHDDLYQDCWLMVDGIQRYYIAYTTDIGFMYERLFTPFDSVESLRFDDLKFINDEQAF